VQREGRSRHEGPAKLPAGDVAELPRFPGQSGSRHDRSTYRVAPEGDGEGTHRSGTECRSDEGSGGSHAQDTQGCEKEVHGSTVVCPVRPATRPKQAAAWGCGKFLKGRAVWEGPLVEPVETRLNKKVPAISGRDFPYGGGTGTRTPNPLLAKQVRYQLRHAPIRSNPSIIP
jgi:hypothetical protein